MLIETPRAPSLVLPRSASPRFEPDPRVSVATRCVLWERAGFDADVPLGEVFRPGPEVTVGQGYVGDVDSQPLGASMSQRTDSNDTRPPYYSASDAGPIIEALIRERGARQDARIITENARAEHEGAEEEIQALRAELRNARQLSEHQVSHIAGIATGSQAQTVALTVQLELERQRVRDVANLSEAQVTHVAGIASHSRAESAVLATELAQAQQRVRDTALLSEAQVTHVTGIAVSGEARTATLAADLER